MEVVAFFKNSTKVIILLCPHSLVIVHKESEGMDMGGGTDCWKDIN